MLKKQSIRSNHTIYVNHNSNPSGKDGIIALSEFWTEKEELLFRKLLKQGGSVKIQGTHFKIAVEEKQKGLRDM
jgi:hypothetical protein|tara:strand:- start:864 stop:1085 length:222 start_codon:yes stop_codon:yes gene_type:complete